MSNRSGIIINIKTLSKDKIKKKIESSISKIFEEEYKEYIHLPLSKPTASATTQPH